MKLKPEKLRLCLHWLLPLYRRCIAAVTSRPLCNHFLLQGEEVFHRTANRSQEEQQEFQKTSDITLPHTN